MNVHVIGEICAGIAVIFSIVYVVLMAGGIRMLRDIRDEMRKKNP